MKKIELTAQDYILVLQALNLAEMFWACRAKEVRGNSTELLLCEAEAEAYRELKCIITEGGKNEPEPVKETPKKEKGEVQPPKAVVVKPEPNEKKPEWGSRKDAAEIAGISLPTVHSLIKQGLIVSRKLGRRTLINLADFREKLASGEISRYKRNERTGEG